MSEATIVADPDVPKVTITREFDAPPERVYRAWAEPDLVRQWMGPRSVDMDIETWDCRTGGAYRYTAMRDGKEVARFSAPSTRPDPASAWCRRSPGTAIPTASRWRR